MKKLSNEELIAFCTQLRMIIRSGISAQEGISIMFEDSKKVQEQELFDKIQERLEEGDSLKEALVTTAAFPEYFLYLIEIGEQAGRLDEVFDSLTKHYEREVIIARSIKSAITYPLIMVGMMVVIVLTLLMKVMPVFSQVYDQLGTQMTGIAAVVLHMGKLLNQYAIILLIIIVVLVVFFIYTFVTSSGRKKMLKLVEKIKPLKDMSEKIALARFTSGISLALKSGLDIDESLELVSHLVENEELAKKIKKCQTLLEEGEDFALGMNKAEIFSGIQARMVMISYQAGAMDEILDQIAEQNEEEAFTKIQSLIGILEPTMVVVISIIVGIILLSVMLPLIGMMSSIS